MALKLNERYPGRFDNPTSEYPQGSFKNRTAPGAKDGSYLEQDWANDKEGFFQSLLDSAGMAPNGFVDKVGSSQYFDALLDVLNLSYFGRLGAVKTFINSGTYNPTAGTKFIVVTVIGGGGGGGGVTASSSGQFTCAGGGGGGGYAKAVITSGFSSVAMSVGAGGVGTSSGTSGAGGSTSFGTFLSATGGDGVLASSPVNIPASYPGYAGGVGTVNTSPAVTKVESGSGGRGTVGVAFSSGNVVSGDGGFSLISAGGVGAPISGGPAGGGAGAANSGGGGGGAFSRGAAAAQMGGNGAAGIIIVEEYM